MSEARVRELHQQLVKAKQRCNESVDKLTYSAVARSIVKQAETMKKQHKRDVDFRVVIKNGRAYLKPVIS